MIADRRLSFVVSCRGENQLSHLIKETGKSRLDKWQSSRLQRSCPLRLLLLRLQVKFFIHFDCRQFLRSYIESNNFCSSLYVTAAAIALRRRIKRFRSFLFVKRIAMKSSSLMMYTLLSRARPLRDRAASPPRK